jgi:hypothetical protein
MQRNSYRFKLEPAKLVEIECHCDIWVVFEFYLYKYFKNFYYLVFRHRVSLCSPGCPAMCSGDQADLGFRDLPASVSPGLGWKAWATTPGFLPGELVGLNQHLVNSCRFLSVSLSPPFSILLLLSSTRGPSPSPWPPQLGSLSSLCPPPPYLLCLMGTNLGPESQPGLPTAGVASSVASRAGGVSGPRPLLPLSL